jgi:hypothetical protein
MEAKMGGFLGKTGEITGERRNCRDVQAIYFFFLIY